MSRSLNPADAANDADYSQGWVWIDEYKEITLEQWNGLLGKVTVPPAGPTSNTIIQK